MTRPSTALVPRTADDLPREAYDKLAAMCGRMANLSRNPVSLYRMLAEAIFELSTVRPYVRPSTRFETRGEEAAYHGGYYTCLAQSLAVMDLTAKRWKLRLKEHRRQLKAERQPKALPTRKAGRR
jgi:hypothetical protein